MSCFLSYTSSITGDCSNLNLGAFTININGEAPDYTIQWLSPHSGTTSLGAGVTAYTQTNLSAGTYSFNIIDSCIPDNTVLPVNIYISSGTCVSITDIKNTVCDANNGSLTATTSNFYGNSIFELYNEITGLISTQYPGTNSYVFNNIPSGTYYVIANDGGGCTGKSESVIIKNSSNLSFGLYKVDNAGCSVDSGKIFITGLTGTPPYTYLWSNGSIEDNISGLTEGTYSVTVTDSSKCSISNTTVINVVPKVALGALYLTQPSCFTADGEIQIVIVGGTPPFYYLGSNGVTNISFDRTVTFTGLGPGGFTIQVTDAGLCNFTTSTRMLTPKGMSTVSVGVSNSKCNDFSGVIGPINIFGGTSPYTYILTDSSGKINSETIYSTTWSFDGLSADTYTLSITDNGGCTFTSAYTINNQVLFGLTVSTTGTTCDSNDGSVYLEITSGGTPPYIYQINGFVITTTLTSYTFNNLVSGNYTASVTDNTYCKQSTLFTIDNSNTIDFHLLGIDSTNNDGSLTAFITNGAPPFTLYFNGDTVGTTVMTIPDLPPGNYDVRIVDSDGCSKRKSLPIFGTKRYESTGIYTICDAKVLNQPITIQTGPKQLLNEGYNELISENPLYTNCVLSAATFQVLVTAGTFSDYSVFYTSYGLLDYPSDELLYDTIQSLLEGSPQIGNVDMNPITNTIVVTTNCDLESLVNTNLNVVIRIDYDIRCATGCFTPTPTKTPTQTPTPTHTPTPTNDISPIVCFTYQGMFWSGVTTYQCEVTAENTLFNGKKWWSLSGCPVNPTIIPPFNCPTDTGFVWWDSGSNIWKYTSTLGGGSYYSFLNNPGNYPIQIIGTYEWVSTMFGTCVPEMLNSFSGPCIPVSSTPTPTPTPTLTKTPTQTPTQTPTNTMTPTPTPTTKTLYYAYSQCGSNPLRDIVIIQPVPAVPGNVPGNVIFDIKNKICWELINTSTDLPQLQNTYNNNTYYTTNFFTEVYGTIFTGSSGNKPCEECLKYVEAVGVTPISCNIKLRNWSDCLKANTSGIVYVNSVSVYSFDANFDVNDVIVQIPVLVGDTITIELTAPTNSSCNFAVSDTDNVGNIFTHNDTITNTTISYSYVTYCGGKKSIEIFSTCLF